MYVYVNSAVGNLCIIIIYIQRWGSIIVKTLLHLCICGHAAL